MSRTSRIVPVTALAPRGSEAGERCVVAESPLALTFNRIPYVVMMVTPGDLEDFIRGFVVTEGLLPPGEKIEPRIEAAGDGWLADIEIGQDRLEKVIERRRNLVGQTSCGLCGIEELSAAVRELPAARAPQPVPAGALFRALDDLPAGQPLNQKTGAAHAAALAGVDGAIRLVREDAGRHTALDKLVGAALATEEELSEGFVLLSSRCSYELVQKALAAGVRLLVTISAPTGLAVELSRKYKLTMVALARPDGMLVFSDPYGSFA